VVQRDIIYDWDIRIIQSSCEWRVSAAIDVNPFCDWRVVTTPAGLFEISIIYEHQLSANLETSASTNLSMHLSHGRDLEHLNFRRLHSVQHSVARRRDIDMLCFPMRSLSHQLQRLMGHVYRAMMKEGDRNQNTWLITMQHSSLSLGRDSTCSSRRA